MTMKLGVARILRRWGFRAVLTFNAIISAAFLAVCALFTIDTPVIVIFVTLVVGGFFRSLEFTSINTLAFADIEPQRASRATSMMSVAQQLSISTGVALGAMIVETSAHLKDRALAGVDDFALAFVLTAAVSVSAAAIFARLKPDAGAEMANRVSDQRAAR